MFRILVFTPLFVLLLACSQPTPTPWPTSTPPGQNSAGVADHATTEPPVQTPEIAEEEPTAVMEPTSEPTPDPNVITTESGLKIKDLVVGDGEEATEGDQVAVHYTGRLLDGTKFDSSLDRGTPFEFTLGAGQVIKGWDEGVATMKVGGKRVLTIPPELAYGDRGAGPIITPGSTLVFDIELLEIK